MYLGFTYNFLNLNKYCNLIIKMHRLSFFDNLTKKYRLWNKEPTTLIVSEHEILHQGYLLKSSKRKSAYIPRYFILTKKALLYTKKKDSKMIYRSLTLKRTRVIYEEKSYNGETAICIKFLMNTKYSSFIISDKKEFRLWKNSLLKVSIQTDFDDKFTTLVCLGRGAFASVYLVFNKEDECKYAVKSYSKSHLNIEPTIKGIMLTEIKILKKVHHPNIVKLEELHESKDSIHIVQEYIQGPDLSKRLESKKVFSLCEIKSILKTLLNCLSYLHKNNIVHRDLKPGNIMIHENDKNIITGVTLIDFGLSTINSKNHNTYVCGTPGYIAPEILRQEKISQNCVYNKVDIFSIGIIAYQIAHGELPFKNDSYSEFLTFNDKCLIVYNSKKMSRYPQLQNLISRMLNASPEDRISITEALEHDFFKLESSKIRLKKLQPK